jgi:hypothetical protein
MSNENKQTAVEWLFSYVFNPSLPQEEQFELLEQAKEMEKEQIEQAFEIGADSYYDLRQPSSCIQYYNETYGGNK